MPHPQTHYYQVTLTVQGWQKEKLDLRFPVWTPGSYLVREYERHLQEFNAITPSQAQPFVWKKCAKNHWQVETNNQTDLTISYRLYANELTVRTNHLDDSHGFFTGAATFFFIPDFTHCPITLTVVPPRSSWQVATTLPAKDVDQNTGAATFWAEDFDTLVDCPVEVGEHTHKTFTVEGKPHHWVVWGEGNLNLEQLTKDTQKIIETEAEIFGGLPYEQYSFLLHLSNGGFGGLEHKESCVLNYRRFGFRETESYQRFLRLVAHEFFHLWNVKRIRPIALETFDYDQENYTPSLWFSEGVTSYYDQLIPLRAGLMTRREFLASFSKEITRLLTTPGRQIQPLAESSYDAWIKLYRRDANSPNSQISYYLKGEMVALLLDLTIRDRHDNQRSFDDVLRQLWQTFGKSETGFTPEQLEACITNIADQDLTAIFHKFLHTTEELPLAEWLERFGLKLQARQGESPPWLGISVKGEGQWTKITSVMSDSPAAQAGITPGDILLAIGQFRVTAEQLGTRLKDYQPNDMIQVTVFNQDRLRTVNIALAPPQATHFELVPLKQPNATQQRNLTGWLGEA